MTNDKCGNAAFVIREYRPEDIDCLCAIDRICFEPEIAYSRSELLFYIKRCNSLAWVAERLGTVVGFAVGRVERNRTAHVLTIDVLPEVRRLGIGKALLERLHEGFRKHNVQLVVLEVNTRNLVAQQFYYKFGYHIVEFLRGYYRSCGDAYRMVLQMTIDN